MAGLNCYGELYRAQLENVSADPTPATALAGRIVYHTGQFRVKFDNGTSYVAVLANDGKCVLGTSVTANTNVRLHRAAVGQMDLMLGGDTTAEGSATAANWAKFNAKLGGSLVDTYVDFTEAASPASPAASTRRIFVKSDGFLYLRDSGGTETVFRPYSSATNVVQQWIINGNFDFWQRGTTFAAAATGDKSADRWKYVKTGSTVVHTISRALDVPTLTESGFFGTYSIKADCTTADAAVAAGDTVGLLYIVEGYDYARLKLNEVTLSFWVKSTKTGTSCVAFKNNASDRSYVAEYTISTTATWEKKTITLTLNPTAGTDNYTSSAGLQIFFTLMAGSTFQTTALTWQTGDFNGTSNQINHSDSTANDFQLSQVQLVFGSLAPTFSRRGNTITGERVFCERYYQKSYDTDTVPAATTTTGAVCFRANQTSHIQPILLRVPMRQAPTVVLYSTSDGATANWRDGTGGANKAAASSNIGENYFQVQITSSVDGNGMTGHFTADAEI